MGPQPTPSLSSQAYQAVTWKGQRLSEEHNFSVSTTTTFSSPPQGNPESSAIATSGHQRDQEIRDRKKHKDFYLFFLQGAGWSGEVESWEQAKDSLLQRFRSPEMETGRRESRSPASEVLMGAGW